MITVCYIFSVAHCQPDLALNLIGFSKQNPKPNIPKILPSTKCWPSPFSTAGMTISIGLIMPSFFSQTRSLWYHIKKDWHSISGGLLSWKLLKMWLGTMLEDLLGDIFKFGNRKICDAIYYDLSSNRNSRCLCYNTFGLPMMMRPCFASMLRLNGSLEDNFLHF